MNSLSGSSHQLAENTALMKKKISYQCSIFSTFAMNSFQIEYLLQETLITMIKDALWSLDRIKFSNCLLICQTFLIHLVHFSIVVSKCLQF
jgi:hypothetical protein